MLVLEARDRVGGRCWTRRVPGLQIPVELGAEFIHGEAKVTQALLKKAGLTAVDSVREQRVLGKGRLRRMNWRGCATWCAGRWPRVRWASARR